MAKKKAAPAPIAIDPLDTPHRCNASRCTNVVEDRTPFCPEHLLEVDPGLLADLALAEIGSPEYQTALAKAIEWVATNASEVTPS